MNRMLIQDSLSNCRQADMYLRQCHQPVLPAMFSLDNTMRYWLYNKPVNLRMGFNGLSGIVNDSMGMNIRSGDVFVFVKAARDCMWTFPSGVRSNLSVMKWELFSNLLNSECFIRIPASQHIL